ncbi:MAG: GCN5-related N-acetyltransferase [Verrucomicrobiales bacterium]|nr:GCN5-related N-acetyltransferase [Verrucomicrobiales bacterium]
MNRLEILDQSHDRSGFDCGAAPLNHYIQQVARQHAERGISRVFVLVEEAGQTSKPILGFFSLAACEAEAETLPTALARKFPRKIPAVRLGRLAVSQSSQGCGLGRDLVLHAMRKTAEGAAAVGVAGLFVDAKDENIAGFYSRFGFIPLPGQPLTLFLPIQTLLQAVAAIQG